MRGIRCYFKKRNKEGNNIPGIVCPSDMGINPITDRKTD